MERVNQWLNLLANVAVLLGIGFLAWELRQNTDAINAQTREAVLYATHDELQAVRENPDLIRSIIQEQPLSVDQQIRLYTWLVSMLRVREYSWLQMRSGTIDETQWHSELAVTLAVLQAPRVRLWWKRVGHETVSAEFRSFIDEQIRTLPLNNGIYQEQTRWADQPMAEIMRELEAD